MNKFFFNNARTALLGCIIAKSQKFKIKKIAVPELICDVIPRTLISHDFDLIYYPVKCDLSVDQNLVKDFILQEEVDMVLDVSFFGTGLNDAIYRVCIDNDTFYCGDLCHQSPSEHILKQKINKKVFFISSPRKMNGLKLGGILYTDLKDVPKLFNEVSFAAHFADGFLSKFLETKKAFKKLLRDKAFYSNPSLLREKKWEYLHYSLKQDTVYLYGNETNHQLDAIASGFSKFCPEWGLKKEIQKNSWVYALATKDSNQQKTLVDTLNKLGVLSSIWPVLPQKLMTRNKKFFFVIIPLLDSKHFDFSRKDFWDEIKKIHKI